QRTTPVAVVGLSGPVWSFAAGGSHVCALIQGGGLQCWGSNASGELGDRTLQSRSQPVSVALSGASALAIGELQPWGLMAVGGSQGWGADGVGQLGDGYSQTNPLPVAVLPEPPPFGIGLLAGAGTLGWLRRRWWKSGALGPRK